MDQVTKKGAYHPGGVSRRSGVFDEGPILLTGSPEALGCPMDSVARGVVPDGNYVWRGESHVEAGVGSETFENRCIPVGMNVWAAAATSFYSSKEPRASANRSRSLVLLRGGVP